MRNGSASALTATVTGWPSTTANDTTDTVSVSPGDTLSISATPSGTPAVGIYSWGVMFTPAVPGQSFLGFGSNIAPSTTASGYEKPIGVGAPRLCLEPSQPGIHHWRDDPESGLRGAGHRPRRRHVPHRDDHPQHGLDTAGRNHDRQHRQRKRNRAERGPHADGPAALWMAESGTPAARHRWCADGLPLYTPVSEPRPQASSSPSWASSGTYLTRATNGAAPWSTLPAPPASTG